ncbi:MAG: stage III sporulation protein AB [Oscillospiraceae bacterium]|nr:stage III sporulation protein AB [Oscillospiraceae bacterium]
MLKIIGIAVIISVTSFAGSYFSASLKNRVVMLKKMNYMLEEISILLRCRSATVYEITEALAADERFSDFDFLKKVLSDRNRPFRESWCEAVSENIPGGAKKSDMELLADIGRRLGASDLDGQISTINIWQSELGSAISSAEADYAGKAKLYRSLGVLSGAFISIMLV